MAVEDWIYYTIIVVVIVVARLTLVPLGKKLAERRRYRQWLRRRQRQGEEGAGRRRPRDDAIGRSLVPNIDNLRGENEDGGRQHDDPPPSWNSLEDSSRDPPQHPTPPPDPEMHMGGGDDVHVDVEDEDEDEDEEADDLPPPSYTVAMKWTEVEERTVERQRY